MKGVSSPIQMIWQIVLVTFSPYRYGYNTEIWLGVSPSHGPHHSELMYSTNMPLIFLKLSHTLIAFILSLCIFFSSPFPLVPTTPNTKWKEEESEATRMLVTGQGGPWREWTQVSGINWRFEDAKHVVLVIPWLQGHVCSRYQPLWINQKNLMRMSFCAYLKASGIMFSST